MRAKSCTGDFTNTAFSTEADKTENASYETSVSMESCDISGQVISSEFSQAASYAARSVSVSGYSAVL